MAPYTRDTHGRNHRMGKESKRVPKSARSRAGTRSARRGQLNKALRMAMDAAFR